MLNFTLTTRDGDLDLLGGLSAVETYENLAADAVDIDVFGIRCKCLSLDQLLRAKRAAGRPKDLEAIAELELLRRESRGHHQE